MTDAQSLAEFLNSPAAVEGDTVNYQYIQIDGEIVALDGEFTAEDLKLIIHRLQKQ